MKLVLKYKIDIGLGAKIGKNFRIRHPVGVVISSSTKIGNNCNIRQFTTIGIKTLDDHPNLVIPENITIEIGNNVSLGTNCCIIGDNIIIGHNVQIGAMSFINKNIPDNYIVYTERNNIVKENPVFK